MIKQDRDASKSVPQTIKNSNNNMIISCYFIQHINETIDLINVFIMSINETEAPNADYHLF